MGVGGHLIGGLPQQSPIRSRRIWRSRPGFPPERGVLQRAPPGHYTAHAVAPPAQPPVVIVIGDVMVDIVVRPTGPFNRGSDTTSRIVATPGGSATNQAVAFAAAGAEVHLVAVVGDDELGRAAVRALAVTGVRAHVEVLPGERTGTVVALIDAAGERSMFSDRGANLRFGSEALNSGLLGPGRHLHLSGYELLDERTRGTALEALELAAAAGMTRSVDPSSAGPLASVGAAAFLGWTDGLDWCCANLEEGRVLTGEQRPADVLASLRQHYREVVLTLGGDGVFFSGPGPKCSSSRPNGSASRTPPGPVTPSPARSWLAA